MRLPLAVILSGLFYAAQSLGAAQATLVGRPVAELLDSAKKEGLNIVFNTQLVPDTLPVMREPEAPSGVALYAEILAPHGLDLVPVGPGVYAVRAHGRAAVPSAANPSAADVDPDRIAEVIVTTSRYALERDPLTASRSQLSSEALVQTPRLAEDTLKAVQRLPGVAANGVSGSMQVRGGDASETLILLDGMTLYEPFHLQDFLSPVSVLDSRTTGNVDFHSGAFSAEYGDRMSAVIDARTVPPATRPAYSLGLSLFHASGYAAGPLQQGSWLVAARQSNLDRVLRLVDDDIGSPKYADGRARVVRSMGDSTRISFDALASRDEVDITWDRSGERASANSRHVYGWLTLEHDWSSALTSRVLATHATSDHARSGTLESSFSGIGRVEDVRSFDVTGLETHFIWNAFGGLHRWGGTARILDAQYRYRSSLTAPGASATERMLEAHPDGQSYALYWSSRFDPGPRVSFELGARVEDQAYLGGAQAVQVEPRGSLLYRLTDDTQLRLSGGRYSQSQRINELQIEDGETRFQPAQHAIHAVVGLDHRISTAVSLRVEAYQKDYDHLRVRYENLSNPLVLLPELQLDRVRLAPVSARVQGIEASIGWQSAGPWSGWLAYTLSRAEDQIGGDYVARSWDQRHAITAGVTWSTETWDVTIAENFHTGWPTTDLALAPGGSSIAGSSVTGQRNATRLSAFNSVDVKASRKFGLPRGELEVFAEIINLLDRPNDCCREHSIDSSAGVQQLITEHASWLGITPSLGIVWNYP